MGWNGRCWSRLCWKVEGEDRGRYKPTREWVERAGMVVFIHTVLSYLVAATRTCWKQGWRLLYIRICSWGKSLNFYRNIGFPFVHWGKDSATGSLLKACLYAVLSTECVDGSKHYSASWPVRHTLLSLCQRKAYLHTFNIWSRSFCTAVLYLACLARLILCFIFFHILYTYICALLIGNIGF